MIGAVTFDAHFARGQMMPGGQGMPGRGSAARTGPTEEIPVTPRADKPDAAAKKAYDAGMKSFNKAKDYDATAAKATDADKKATALQKANDAYDRALDQFTEAVSNKGDLVEAWSNVGYIHLRLGAYAESLDDYNHVLMLKPDLLDAVEQRGEAYLHIDRVEDAKSAYMDLFNHDRPRADKLLASMRKWLVDHRANPSGVRAGDLDSFDKWLQERDRIEQTAAR